MSSLNEALKQIKKDFKKKNEDLVFDPDKKFESLPSGDVIFDFVSGIGGFPKGRITEIIGMEGSCKSSLVYASLAGVQRRKGVGILFDHENAFSREYAENTFGLTVDSKHFGLFQPNNLEEGMEVFDRLTGLGDSKNDPIGEIDLIVFDSIDAMKPKSIIESSNSKEDRIGAHAKAMGKVMQKARVISKKYNCPIVFINQMRNSIQTNRYEQNIGTATGFNVMESYTTTGGLATRYAASLRIKLEYKGQLQDETAINPVSGKQEKQRVGNWIKVTNIKSRVSTPYRKGETLFEFPSETCKGGFNRGEALLAIMKNRGYASQQSRKFHYEGYQIDDYTKVGSKVSSMKDFLTGEGSEARINDMYLRALSHLKGDAKDNRFLDVLSSDEISTLQKGDKEAGSLKDILTDPDDLTPAKGIVEI